MSAVDNPLVSTDWLHQHLGDPHLKVLDATWYLPGDPRDPKADFLRARIPGARFFDLDAVADHSTALPHMVPTPEDFALAVEQLGISDGDTVVAYHDAEMLSAPRVWWMFRLFGHSHVFVLDGGLSKWGAEGRPVEDGPADPPPMGRFTPQFDRELIRDLEQVREALESGDEQVIDARSAARYLGQLDEPRAGVRAGHMPGGLNLPANTLFGPDGVMLPEGELARAFANAGALPDQPIVTSCGSGVSACSLNLALARLGHWRAAVYDGSWTEWGSRPDTPVIAGP